VGLNKCTINKRLLEVGVTTHGVEKTFLIPDLDGAIISFEWKEALWASFFTAAPPRQKQSVHCPAGDCAAIAERGAIQNSEESLRALPTRYGSEEAQKTIQ
jgi:hypothetical protein